MSYLTMDMLVEKRMLMTIALEGRTTGEEIANTVLVSLEEEGINPKRMMSVSTDGCLPFGHDWSAEGSPDNLEENHNSS